MLGRRTFALLKDLQASQWWPRERIVDLQVARLRDLATAAYEHTMYWRTLMAERGIVPIFGTIPPRGFGDPESKPEAGYNAALIRKCADLKVPCGHLFEEYQSLPNRKELIADDGVHNTAAGMTASARAWRRTPWRRAGCSTTRRARPAWTYRSR